MNADRCSLAFQSMPSRWFKSNDTNGLLHLRAVHCLIGLSLGARTPILGHVLGGMTLPCSINYYCCPVRGAFRVLKVLHCCSHCTLQDLSARGEISPATASLAASVWTGMLLDVNWYFDSRHRIDRFRAGQIVPALPPSDLYHVDLKSIFWLRLTFRSVAQFSPRCSYGGSLGHCSRRDRNPQGAERRNRILSVLQGGTSRIATVCKSFSAALNRIRTVPADYSEKQEVVEH